MAFRGLATLKLTLSTRLGSVGRRVSKSGEVSKSFFIPVIMYVEHQHVYRKREEQHVDSIPGPVLFLNTSVVVCAFSFLSGAPVPFLRSIFYIWISI